MSDATITTSDVSPTLQRLMHTTISPDQRVKPETGYDGALHLRVPSVATTDPLPLIACELCGAAICAEPHRVSQHAQWHSTLKPWGVL